MSLFRHLLAGALAAASWVSASDVAEDEPPESAAPLTWGIVPSGPEGPGDRGAFDFVMDPGASRTDVVAVANYSERPLTLAVYAHDAVRSTNGGFDLLPATEEPVDVGSWVVLDETPLTVPARSRVDVPFRIRVPANATPGDHAGGIVASLATEPGGLSSGEVTVDRRVGARIYVRVSGTLDPRLAATDVHASFSGLPVGAPGEIRVDYTVRNTGNVRLSGRPTVRVAGPFGLGTREVTGEPLPELLPGDSVTTSAVVDGVWPLVRLDVDVTVQPESSGDQLLEPPPASGSAGVHVWAVPWVVLAVLGALVLAVVVRLRRRRRSRGPTPVSTSASVAA